MKKNNGDVVKALTMVTQIGISMLVSVLGSGFIGLKLDQWLSTDCFFVIFLIMGILAAFRSLYFLTKQFYARNLEKEQKEQEYFNQLDRERERKRKNNF